MDNNMLENYDKQITEIDYEILILIKRRFLMIKKLGKYKFDKNLELNPLKYDDKMNDRVIVKSAEMGIREGFSRKIFLEIIEECKREQKQFLEKKYPELIEK